MAMPSVERCAAEVICAYLGEPNASATVAKSAATPARYRLKIKAVNRIAVGESPNAAPNSIDASAFSTTARLQKRNIRGSTQPQQTGRVTIAACVGVRVTQRESLSPSSRPFLKDET